MSKKNIVIFIITIILLVGIIIGFYFWQKNKKENQNIPEPIMTIMNTPQAQEPTPTLEFNENSSSESLIEETLSEIEKDISEINTEEDFKSFENSDVGL